MIRNFIKRKRPKKRNRAIIVIALLLPLALLFFYKTSPNLPLVGKFSSSPKAMLYNQAKWDKMVERLEKASRAYRGNVGVYFKDLHTGKVWEYKADKLFPSASLIKLPIMAAVFEKIKKGDLSFDTQIRLTRRERRGGSGTLKWAREGTKLSVMELLYKMITESDNTATNMLSDYVGMNYLQREFSEMDLVYTNIYPEGFNLTSGRVARENYTTAREMAGLIERIYNKELVDEQSSELMMDFLKHLKTRTRLRRGLPIGWELAHKTGLLRRSCHDVGIVFSPQGDYIIAVLTGNVPNYSSAKKFITKIAKHTVDYYKVESSIANTIKSKRSKSL
ncbi:MAG: serine hydrolase [Elusimicrobiota bacterium]|nr:serine hydrolase [Elusimicrobiota bacterium]